MVKILFPVEVFFPSQAGGTANTIYWITKNLAGRGFEPVIIATNKGIGSEITLNTWLDLDCGKTIYIKTYFLHFPLFQMFISLFHIYRSDIVQLSSLFFPTAFLSALAARLFQKKLIWSIHGELAPGALNHSRLRKKPILWLIRKLSGHYPLFHSTSDEETAYIREFFGPGSRIIQIPNYIEVPQLMPRNPSKYLLYIGRLHPVKALDNLLRALSLSDSFRNSEFVLKIAGKGKSEVEKDLRNLVSRLSLSEKVVFLGQIEGIKKQKLLADAYFTILPSQTENFGMVVLESLAQSTPVIASKGTPWQSLNEEKIGFWVENSPEKLAETIDEILQFPRSVYEEYRARTRPFVERQFEIGENIVRWIELYKCL